MGRSRGLTKIAKDIDARGNLLASAISPDVTLGGATVYANRSNLPVSGNTAGDQAYVTANNRLYIWNGSGWYNVALLNVAPAISSIQDSDGNTTPFRLSTEGAVTTITITAADSDGDPITYSATADSDFAGLATISDSDNVFTITPLSQDSASTTSGTITFKATDGVNIASSGVQTFTLVFVSEYWKDIVFSLSTSSTNSLDNSTFIDRSTNAYTVDAQIYYGKPDQSPFHPFFDNWSVEFNGSDGYLTIQDDSLTNTGSITVEGWFYVRDLSSRNTIFLWADTNNISENNDLTIDTNGTIYTRFGNASTAISTNAVSINEWYHFAVVRNSSNVSTVYINGTVWISNVSGSGDLDNTLNIGYNPYDGGRNYFDGYISNFRSVESEVYTSSFTPPTEKLAAITNTELLTCQSNRFIDNSSNDYAITASGTPKISTFNPFGQGSEYVAGENKGSVYNNGSSRYIVFPSDFNFYMTDGSTINDYVISFWHYSFDTSRRGFFGDRSHSGTNGGAWSVSSDNYTAYVTGRNSVVGGQVIPNQWNYVQFRQIGSTANWYVNGEVSGTPNQTALNHYTNSGGLRIGEEKLENQNSYRLNGYISDLAFITDSNEYPNAADVPTSPIGNSGAHAYLPFDNLGIFDKTGNHDLTLVGDTSTSNTQTKFADTAIYFDGNDRISLDDNDTFGFGTGDFTFEFWLNYKGGNGYVCFFNNASDSGNYIYYGLNTGTKNPWVWNAANVLTTTTAVTNDVWQHHAVTRENGTLRIYLNGTQIGTTSWNVDLGSSRPLYIGSTVSATQGTIGYIENFQIIKGVAKYTSNFTVPNQEQGRLYQAED